MQAMVLHSLGLDINALDNSGRTPLDWACARPDVEEVLKSFGAVSSSRFSTCVIL